VALVNVTTLREVLEREPADLRAQRLAKLIIAGKRAAAHMGQAREAVGRAAQHTVKGSGCAASTSHSGAANHFGIAAGYVRELMELLDG